MTDKKPRGFAAMSREKLIECASKGGVAAHAQGTAHQFTSDEARKASYQRRWIKKQPEAASDATIEVQTEA